MNRTKKRAYKRAQARSVAFKYPYPLTAEFKIKNLKAVWKAFGLGLAEAKARVETDMGIKPVIDVDLLI